MCEQNLATSRRFFKKVGVIGSGVMGSGIAAHLANAGIDCLLLDIVPSELSINDKESGLTKTSKNFRNKIVNIGLSKAIRSKPSLFFSKKSIKKIKVGNLEDNLNDLVSCDWVIEAVVEDLNIKHKLFEMLENTLSLKTIISSNTSGLSISKMLNGRSVDFKKRFLVTHFFNPVRYLHLLEIVKSSETSQDVISKIVKFGEDILGKGIVYGKDTSNFIANRIGIFSLMEIIKLMCENNYSIEEVDAIFGAAFGRPRSAVFRTLDLVGIDTFIHVANNCYDTLMKDEKHDVFKIPSFFNGMIDNGFLGSKNNNGFYKKIGKEVKVLDLSTMKYRAKEKVRIDSLGSIKNMDNIADKIRFLNSAKDRAGVLSFQVIAATCIYAANRLGEISDDILQIDNAMKWGFGWTFGPFEMWDVIGVKDSSKKMIDNGYNVPNWVLKMLDNGVNSFYKTNSEGELTYYNPKSLNNVSLKNDIKILNINFLKFKSSNIIKDSFSTSLIDLGDNILCCEFHTKMNSIDDGVIDDINDAINLCENGKFGALVLANDSANFSIGANLLLIYMFAKQKKWVEINNSIKKFQNVCKRLKYSNIPTVAAPYNLTLGGGAELSLWCNRIRSHAELYMGLVEVGVGLIPGGGGNIEILSRTLSGVIDEPTYSVDNLIKRSLEIVAMAKVVTSAAEAKDNLYMSESDGITMNRRQLLRSAKNEAWGMAAAGFTPPEKRFFRLPGENSYGTFKMFLKSMNDGEFISDHDLKISMKIAYIMTGGDCSSRDVVSEDYLLDLEREAFLSLCGEEKSQDRIAFMLENNKPLRN